VIHTPVACSLWSAEKHWRRAEGIEHGKETPKRDTLTSLWTKQYYQRQHVSNEQDDLPYKQATIDTHNEQMESTMKKLISKTADYLPQVILLTLLISGCVHSPTAKLYLLRSEIASTEIIAKPAAEKPLIILRPIQMAEYLNRPQIVIRKGEREVANAEFDRWAEPLATQAEAYCVDALAADCKDFTVRPFPWRGETKPLFEISISIIQLDGIPGDAVRMRADWQILQGGENPHMITGERSDLVVKCSDPGIPGIVAATEELLDKLSQTIATTVNKQHSPGK